MTSVTQGQLRAYKLLCALTIIAGTASAVSAATASWDRNSDPGVAGYKLSYGTQPGVHTVVVDVGNFTTYQFNPQPGLRYYVVVQAYNTAGELSEKSSEVIVDIPRVDIPPTTINRPPTLAQPANQTSAKNANVSLALSASDPEGDALQFTAAGLPSGLSIDRASGLISGRVRGTGSDQVVVTVSDGALSASRSFSWKVVNGSGRTSTALETATLQEVSDASSVEGSEGVAGDFDGDGRADLATYRHSPSEWRIWASGSNFTSPAVRVWGVTGDRPVPADYDGDRVTDFAVYRPSTGTWHVALSGTQTPLSVHWGTAEDVPFPLDHDGDGKADLALVREGGYEILLSSSNYLKSVQVR